MMEAEKSTAERLIGTEEGSCIVAAVGWVTIYEIRTVYIDAQKSAEMLIIELALRQGLILYLQNVVTIACSISVSRDTNTSFCGQLVVWSQS
jgi:hypothetical protein